MIRAAGRLDSFEYAVLDIAVLAGERAAAGHEMLYLNLGDPLLYDFETPAPILEAAQRALRDGITSYAPPHGIPEAIEAVGRFATGSGIRNIQDIFITTGVTETIDLVLSALVDEGEGVLLPRPGYPFYNACLAKLGARTQLYDLDEGRGFEPDVEQMARAIDSRTRAIVLVSPNNPTGASCSVKTMRAILALAREHELVVLSDEAYSSYHFDGESQVSIASLDPDAAVVTMNGLSKNYLSPGLRVGWGVVSGAPGLLDGLLEGVGKLLRARVCANHPMMHAVAAALDGDCGHQEEVMAKLTRRRAIAVGGLEKIPGIECATPTGAFYAFPRLLIAGSDRDWARQLILDEGVVTVPGSGFGQAEGTQHIRMVLLPPEEILERAIAAIARHQERWLHAESET